MRAFLTLLQEKSLQSRCGENDPYCLFSVSPSHIYLPPISLSSHQYRSFFLVLHIFFQCKGAVGVVTVFEMHEADQISTSMLICMLS